MHKQYQNITKKQKRNKTVRIKPKIEVDCKKTTMITREY